MARLIRLDDLNDEGLTAEQKFDAVAMALRLILAVLEDQLHAELFGMVDEDGNILVAVPDMKHDETSEEGKAQ